MAKNANKNDDIAAPSTTSRINVAIVGALVVLLLVIIFVAQNSQSVSIKFLGLNGHISLGLAMLIAAVAGGIIVTLFGSARILQLRHRAHKSAKASNTPEPVATKAEPEVDLEPSAPANTLK